MNLRRFTILGFLIFAMFSPARAEYAGVEKTFVLFDGASLDSTEHFSRWIPVKDAMRIVFRTWSTHAAFTGSGAGDVDSTTSDSINIFKVSFSDSVSFIAVDSAGTVVTARSTIPRTIGTHGEPYPICADSIQFATANYTDSTFTHTQMRNAPVNVALRAPATGSGRLAAIYNLVPGGIAVCGDCTLQKQYMKVSITPLRRMTVSGFSSTAGIRVNGLKGLRMTATVIYRQH